MIPFNIPAVTGKELDYLKEVIENRKICGDGVFTERCRNYLETRFKSPCVLLTTSCTHALEMAGILADLKQGDEVILPSYTFSSTANAFALRGAKLVFVDIRPDTMNINERLIEEAITEKTKAIVVVHYAGVACEMDPIMEVAERYHLLVIEDAAQGVMSSYKGRALGTIGHFGCYSFHETKNYSSGEGGALLINDHRFVDRAEIIREKGTNRKQFILGHVDKYTWVDVGSSYLPSEFNAAHLYAQLEMADEINEDRLSSYSNYKKALLPLEKEGLIELPKVPEYCKHNAHMFFIKLANEHARAKMMAYLKEKGVSAVFHYLPLHSAEAGRAYGRFHGVDQYTTKESKRLLRLPMYYQLGKENVDYIAQQIRSFYEKQHQQVV